MEQNDFQPKYNSLLIETARFLVKFLDDHGIDYYAACGTAIGAVRHNGLIPWDDDIDIMIYRKDLQKLLSVKDEMLEYGYKFVTYADDGYYFYHSKVIKLDTSLWEIESHPYSGGIFVDVFYLYRTPSPVSVIRNNMGILTKKIQNYFISIERFTTLGFLKHLFNVFVDSVKGDYKRFPAYVYHKLFMRDSKRYLKELESFDASLDEPIGDKLVCYSERKWGYKEIFEASWFDGFVEFPFEGFKIRLPKNYHAMLTQLYGDYMQLPPVEKRKLEHNNLRYYINLKEHLSVPEMKKRIKKGEKCVW